MSSFPAVIDSDSTLLVTSNFVRTTLTAGVSPSATSFTVTSAVGIYKYTLLTLDTEIVRVTTNPTGGTFSVQRGYDSTTQAAHVSGTLVLGNVDSAHQRTLKNAVIAIENALGTNLSNIRDNHVFADSYNFDPQIPGGSLIIGSNTITLSPVPRGVNGSDASHYLYISNGTGTAEACLITGGTAVSDADSGTVIVTCAHTHSGAWTIESDTGGIREAMIYNPAGTTIYLPANVTTQVGKPLVVDKINITIQGSGWSSVLKARDSAVLHYIISVPTSAGAGLCVRDLKIDGNRDNNGTVDIYGAAAQIGSDTETGLNNFSFIHNEITKCARFGVVIIGSGDGFIFYDNNVHDNGGVIGASSGTGLAHIEVPLGSGYLITGAIIARNRFRRNYNTVSTVGASAAINWVAPDCIICENYLEDNFNAPGGQIFTKARIVCNNDIVLTTTVLDEGTSGIEVNGPNTIVAHNYIRDHFASAGIAVEDSDNATMTGNIIIGARIGIWLILAEKKANITGNRISTGLVAGRVAVFISGTSEDIVVTGNNFVGSQGYVSDNAPNGSQIENNIPDLANFKYRGTIGAATTISAIRSGEVITVSGSGTITTLTLMAYVSTGAEVTLIPAAGATWITSLAGNIGLASTAVVGKALRFVWDGSKWWPSY